MASKFEVEDIYVPHADGVHHDRYRHSSSGWYFVSPSGKVSSKRVSQALAIVLDWAKQNRLDHEYFVQTVMMNMGTLNMALSGQPVELKRGEPGWTPELDNIRELRAQLAEAEGQARGSEAMLIQAQRDCDNAQNAELVALSQLAEMTKALDIVGIRRCDDDDPPTWTMEDENGEHGFDTPTEAARFGLECLNVERKRYESLLAERDAQVERMREALEQLVEPSGAYSRDKLTWAQNTIDSVSRIAKDALAALATGPRATEEG